MTVGLFPGGVPLPDRTEPTDHWMPYGSCRGADPAKFFPGQGEPTWQAKQICHGCPVRKECGDYALRNDEKYGIWGGMSEKQRRAIRRLRRQGQTVDDIEATG